jgi:hypothetical protein
VLYLSFAQRYCLVVMTTLADIETAAAALTEGQKQELLLFLAASLRRARAQAPEPRQFSADTIKAWIAEDEADFERLSRRP